ncbi:MAG: hypothetical protein ACRCXL_01490 [Dermatophilaceae bacterium]
MSRLARLHPIDSPETDPLALGPVGSGNPSWHAEPQLSRDPRLPSDEQLSWMLRQVAPSYEADIEALLNRARTRAATNDPSPSSERAARAVTGTRGEVSRNGVSAGAAGSAVAAVSAGAAVNAGAASAMTAPPAAASVPQCYGLAPGNATEG